MTEQLPPPPSQGAYNPYYGRDYWAYYTQAYNPSAAVAFPSGTSSFPASSSSGLVPVPSASSSSQTTTTTTTPASASIAADPPRKRARVLPLNASDRDKALARVKGLTDEEVWTEDEDIVVEAASLGWKSPAYRHYDVTIKKCTSSHGTRFMKFVFSCKHGDAGHNVQYRKRMSTKHGTTNLLRTAKACDRRGRRSPSATPLDIPEYSEARHRLLIALRCCVSKRPFEMVRDDIYGLEVDMLSGVHRALPSPQTVSNDTLDIYDGVSVEVQNYFKNRSRVVHIVNDGWTTPLHTSTLGFLVIWEDAGRLYRCLIEIVTLTKSHTGLYLAETLADALKRYGLDRLLHLLNMDNASNCDTLARNLPSWIPHFQGMLARLRCFLHAVQLIAKMILKFFNKEYRRKTRSNGDAAASMSTDTPEEEADHEELADALEPEQYEREAQTRSEDPAKAMYEEEVVSEKKVTAIEEMAGRGVTFTDADSRQAKSLLPKVAGLAVRIRDSAVLPSALNAIIDARDAQGQPEAPIDTRYAARATTMATRNATRWDGDYACLKSALALRSPLTKLTANSALKLGTYKLNGNLWKLSADLYDVLSAIHDITMKFQHANVPLIIEVLPAFIKLQRRLKNMSNSSELPNILRVAAHAGYLVSLEYFTKFQDCKAYAFAIALCPDRKLEWFHANGYTDDEVADLRRDLVAEFRSRWKSPSRASPPSPASSSATPSSSPPQQPGASRFDDPLEASTSAPSVNHLDDIETYLSTPCTPIYRPPPDPDAPPEKHPVVPELLHWHLELRRVPHLAEMALAYVSAPATSGDMERGFSEGRNQVNWNQHQMSPRTLKAKMSVCSWYRQPFWDMEIATEIVAEGSRPLRE